MIYQKNHKMLTKIQAEIMKVFVSNISEKFSINQVSKMIKKPYALVHRSIQELIKNRYVIRDKQKYLSLNYKENIPELSYIESLKRKELLKENKSLILFSQDIIKKVKEDLFILLIFGSYVKKVKNPRDIDVLFIVKEDIEKYEKLLTNVASYFSFKFDINVISLESAYEMLNQRDKPNIMNETLNNHILIFGAENYYNILKNAR